MSFPLAVGLIALAMFLGIGGMLEVGKRLGRRQRAKDTHATEGTGSIEAAAFALLGLLIAFTFSGGLERFDNRRHLVVEEANLIGTAYLRVDLLPAQLQPTLRDAFRRYVDARIATYRKLPDVAAAREQVALSLDIQNELWRDAVAACKQANDSPTTMLLLGAINPMIDILTTRTMAAELHPPRAVYVMLLVAVLIAALFAGHGMAVSDRRKWLHIVGFAAIVATTIYVILDIEYPRFGLVRVDAVDHALSDLRARM